MPDSAEMPAPVRMTMRSKRAMREKYPATVTAASLAGGGLQRGDLRLQLADAGLELRMVRPTSSA